MIRTLLMTVALVAMPLYADDIGVNLGFDELVEREDGSTGLAGWNLNAGGLELRVDEEMKHDGRQSLRFRRGDGNGNGFASQGLDVDELRGRELIVTGYLRGEGVEGGYSGPFVRVDGPGGILVNERMDVFEPRGDFPWSRFELRVLVDREATAAYLGILVTGEGTIWIDDLDLRTASRPRDEAGPEVMAYLDAAWEVFRAESILRDEVDWDELREVTEAQLRGRRHSDQAWGAMRGALDRINDGHSRFMTPPEILRWANRPPTERVAEESTPTAKLIDGRIGYVEVPTLHSRERQTQLNYAVILHRLLRRADEHDPCGYIVDLRGNPGGNMWPMLLGLGPLLGEGELGAFVDADGEGERWSYREGAVYSGEQRLMSLDEPLETMAPLPAVAVLTDRGTGSSAEYITAAFRERTRTRSFGQDTYGASTGNRGFVMPDGSRIFLTTTVLADRIGTTFGGPIPVDEPVEPARDEVDLDHDPVVRAAKDWLATEHACGTASTMELSPG